MYSAKKEKAMKGIRTFASQTEGLQYFVGRVIEAANRGSFTYDVKGLFQQELEKDNDGSAKFWWLRCHPILSFFSAIGSYDRTMQTSSAAQLKRAPGTSYLVGSATWRATWTGGRFIHLLFAGDGSCKMYYDTGYDEKGRPKGKSTFLNLPAQGDEDLSGMGQEEFTVLAFPPPPPPPPMTE